MSFDEHGRASEGDALAASGSAATWGDTPSVTETAVLKVYAAAKTAVIKRDTDLLTKDEVSRLSREVSAAILEELTIWVKYKCFERRPLKGAHNVMDSRHVLKWEYVKGPM